MGRTSSSRRGNVPQTASEKQGWEEIRPLTRGVANIVCHPNEESWDTDRGVGSGPTAALLLERQGFEEWLAASSYYEEKVAIKVGESIQSERVEGTKVTGRASCKGTRVIFTPVDPHNDQPTEDQPQWWETKYPPLADEDPRERLASLQPVAWWKNHRITSGWRTRRIVELRKRHPELRNALRTLLLEAAMQTDAGDGRPIWIGAPTAQVSTLQLYWAIAETMTRQVVSGNGDWSCLNNLEEEAMKALGEDTKRRNKAREERRAQKAEQRGREEERTTYVDGADQDPLWGWLRKWQVAVGRTEDSLDRIRGYQPRDVERILESRIRHYTESRHPNAHMDMLDAKNALSEFVRERREHSEAHRSASAGSTVMGDIARRAAARRAAGTPVAEPTPTPTVDEEMKREIEAALAKRNAPGPRRAAPRALRDE
ncbi:hypothetical protein HYW18_00160 [Candidatus Uhrbacteria bacterium]|nr:hypothetical protein [Candidatus Uhrbacteria bacterium]